jgi:heme exporter protein B
MLAFSFAVTLALAFTLPGGQGLARPARLPADLSGLVSVGDVIAGFLWVTVLFAGLIGFARTFEVDREEGAVDALLLAPVDRSALFAAKAAANLVFVTLLEALLVPAFALLFSIPAGTSWGALVLVLLLADAGFAAIGTLFSSLSAQTRSSELILPVLALPALVPVFIAAVELTARIFLGFPATAVAGTGWFVLLCAFDVIFLVVGALAFEYTLD